MDTRDFGLLIAKAVEEAIHYDIASGDGYDLGNIVDAVSARFGIESWHIDATGLSLAGLGRKHFGNPIPKEWYAAARELIELSKETK